MQIYEGDIWRCISCNKTGDYDTLKDLMGDDLAYPCRPARQAKTTRGAYRGQ